MTGGVLDRHSNPRPPPPHRGGAYSAVTRQLNVGPDSEHALGAWEHSASPQSSLAATLVDRVCDRIAAELQHDARAFARWQPRDERFKKELPRLEKNRASLSARAFADPAWVERLNRRNTRYALLRELLDAAIAHDRPAVEEALAIMGTNARSLLGTFDSLAVRYMYSGPGRPVTPTSAAYSAGCG